MKKFLVTILLIASFFWGFTLFYQKNYEVPILMYHEIGYATEGTSLVVTPETFDRQMEFLKVHRYHVMPLAELIQMIQDKEPLPRNAIAITFDDGFLDNFTYGFPILKQMKFPATIFMITRNINEKGWLSEEDLRILDEAGISIGSHTVTHAHLPDLTSMDVIFELGVSKRRLERILGHPVTLLSYPAGGFTKETPRFVEKEGYAGAVTTNRGQGKHNVNALHRIKVTQNDKNLIRFWAKTTGLYHVGKRRRVVPAEHRVR